MKGKAQYVCHLNEKIGIVNSVNIGMDGRLGPHVTGGTGSADNERINVRRGKTYR